MKLTLNKVQSEFFTKYRSMYIKVLNKRGCLHLALNFFRSILLNFKINLIDTTSSLKILFERACIAAVPSFYLKKLTLAGLEYKVPWIPGNKKRISRDCTFVLKSVKRKGVSKQKKLGLVLSQALYNEGEAISNKNEIFKLGRENRGLIFFIKK